MGKRNRRKLSLKSQNNSRLSIENEPHSLLMSKEHCLSDSSSESIRLMRQVKDCISEIYTEHINDLEQRKKKRLECKVPTEFFSPYNLVVNLPFQQRIRLQIQSVIKFQLGEALRENVISCMMEFIDYLKVFVKKFDGKKSFLRAIIVFEAFHTLQNSIAQVGSIVSELISKYAFDIMNKKAFCEKIANSYFDLIEEIVKKENSQYVSDLRKMKFELENLQISNEEERNFRLEYASTIYSDSCSELDESTGEAMHNMSIDELVLILSQDKITPKRKRNAKKKKRSRDEGNFETKLRDLDEEVNEFAKNLELHKNSPVKLKPEFSDSFLNSLKEKLRSLQNTH